jgi:D-alanyl-D-alanine carboxypeptidase (penicillin-binding protein 5/6)
LPPKSHSFTPATVRWLLLIWIAGLCASTVQAAEIQIAAQAAVLMDTVSGKILWQRNQDQPLAPASTTKILTALVVLERSKLDDVATVPREAALVSGNTVHLQTDEQLTVEQFLYGMLLGSANDAAVALANHSGGLVAQFVDLMNAKAQHLGAQRSRFRNVTGLPEKGHVTTAQDLATITRAALTNPAFRKIVAHKQYRWKSASAQGELKNSNILLATYRGAIGVKTGNTREAGFCLVAAAARGKQSLIAVILKSTEKSGFEDAKKILDHGFKNFGAH